MSAKAFRRRMYFATVAWLTPMHEHQELAVDTRHTPERVCAVHLPDQLTNFARY